MKTVLKKTLALILTLMVVFGGVAIGGEGFGKMLNIMGIKASAVTESDFISKINSLQQTFKNGEYWNYYNASDYSHSGTTPCNGTSYSSAHNGMSCSSVGYCDNCSCKCGYFAGGYQCFGYANKLANEIFGKYHGNGYTDTYSVGEIFAGDIIRFGTSDTVGHSIFIYKVEGNTIYFTECNYSGPCKIGWGKTLSNLSSSTYYAGFKFLYVSHLSGNTLKGTGHTCDFYGSSATVTIKKAPTKTATGTRVYKCSCGKTVEETIPKINYTTDLTEGIYTITTKCNTSLKIASSSASGYNYNVFIADNSYADQYWLFRKNSDGTYTFENAVYDGKVIDVEGIDMHRAGNIFCCDYNGGNNQKFYNT